MTPTHQIDNEAATDVLSGLTAMVQQFAPHATGRLQHIGQCRQSAEGPAGVNLPR